MCVMLVKLDILVFGICLLIANYPGIVHRTNIMREGPSVFQRNILHNMLAYTVTYILLFTL